MTQNEFAIDSNMYIIIKNGGAVMRSCALFGHRVVFEEEAVYKRLIEKLQTLVDEGFDHFLIGTHGDFDRIGLGALRWVRYNYKKIKIKLVFSGTKLLGSRSKKGYLEDWLCDVETTSYFVEDRHFKNRITITNQNMIDDCAMVLCLYDLTVHSVGVANAVKYAKKRGKRVINLFSEKEYLKFREEQRSSFEEEFNGKKEKL